MLSQKEVYDIMKSDILELQRKRIAELEDAIYKLTTEIAASNIPVSLSVRAEGILAMKMAEKGISL